MMFLLRVAFWLSIVLVLLPSGGSKQTRQDSEQGAPIGALEAASAASATVSDMRQFCARQPDACAIGTQALVAFGQRAQAGAQMIYEIITEKLAAQDANPTGAVKRTTPAASKPSQNTLTPVDLAPQWQGPPAREDGGRRPT